MSAWLAADLSVGMTLVWVPPTACPHPCHCLQGVSLGRCGKCVPVQRLGRAGGRASAHAGLSPSLPASFCFCLFCSLSVLHFSDIPILSKSPEVFRRLPGGEVGTERCLGAWRTGQSWSLPLGSVTANAHPRYELGSVVCTWAYPSSPAICHHCTRSGEDGVEGYVDRLGNECE